MFALIAASFGLIIGSFLNVVVLRRGAKALSGRSGCFTCGKAIAWYDLIPVISWVVLRGRCRNCGSKISIQYPLVEATTGILFGILGYWATPFFLLGDAAMVGICAVGFLITAILVAIAAYDFLHTIIPDAWAYLFGVFALVFRLLLLNEAHLLSHSTLPFWVLLAGPLCALPLFLLWLVSKGTWMGLGDAKLALGIGWLLGLWDGMISIMFSFMLGSAILVPLLLFTHIPGLTDARKGLTMKSEVPFGPFLIASCFIFLFLGLFGIPLPFIE